MAVLNTWQKITRVLPGKPFGDGRDGVYTDTTIPTLTLKSCSGVLGSTTLTIASAGFSNNDVVLIHQTRGTGAGQWEINKIASGGGSTSLTMSQALVYDYLNSGNSRAQIIKIPMYSSVNVASGTWNVSSWDGTINGILVFACQTDATLACTINYNGSDGTDATVGSASGGTGKGFSGGTGISSNGNPAYQGEGTSGVGATLTAANGNGGGGGDATNDGGSGGAGGGGGNAAAGSTGTSAVNGVGGTGGGAAGSADLTTMVFGGGGGGGCRAATTDIGGGGGGGGIVMLIAKNLVISSATINGNGGAGGTSGAASGYGGGGGGGSALIVCSTATLGTNVITATAGSGGGAGSVGRVAVHHSKTVTGTTNPSFTDVSDTSLVDTSSILNLSSKSW